jgi:biotin operon repressor
MNFSESGERQLRTVVEALRNAGLPVCAHPSHGYYVAENAQEIDPPVCFSTTAR